MIYLSQSQLKNKKGFTLVETLVAITVLVVAIVGPLYVVHKSIAASYAARDKLIATALAQEGLEYVRSVRDDNYLTGRNWMTGLNGSNNGSNSANCFSNNCTVDQGQDDTVACSSSGCAPLRITSANLYTQAGGNPLTKFTRSVRLTTVNANEVEVEVTVTWETLRIPYSTTVSEHLYNWL